MIPQQGLASLPQAQQGPMQGGPMQGPMPGQAPQQMPGMMPQQGAPTPGAMTGSLKSMPLDQLKMMYMNPQPNSPPLWAVISALAEKQKEAQAMQMAQGQQAMAQNAQMQQEPPVAAQVMQSAEQMQEPVMAAQGGMLQGYAGGGAVAFRDAGVVGLQNPEYDEEGLPRTNEERQRIERNNRIFLEQQRNVEAQKQLQAQKARVRETSGVVPQQQLDFYRSTGREKLNIPVSMEAPMSAPERSTVMPGAAAAQPTAFDITNPSSINALRMAAQDTRLPEAERADLQRRIAMLAQQAPSRGIQAAAQAAASAPITGLPALSAERQAEIKADQERAEEIARSRAEAAARMGTTSPEVLASRERLQQVLGSAYDPQRKSLEEARAAQAQGLFGNAEALGRMAAATGGAKRFGQGLAAAAGAGSEFMGEQRRRIEGLQDRYNALKSQLDITMAQAQHADAVGDDKLKRDALMKAEDIKAELFNTQRGIRKEAVAEQTQQASGIAALRNAASNEAQVRRPTEFEQYQAAPDQYSKFVSAKTPGKSPYDMIMDNVRADYKIWADSMQGKMADPVAQKTKLQELYTYHVGKARAQGVQLPAGAEGPAPAQNDPLGLR